MDEPSKMYTLLASVSRAQLITSWVENTIIVCVRFSKLVHFQIHRPLNILTVLNWLNYFLIDSKVKFRIL